MSKKLRVVNTETGEDLSEIYTLRHRNQDEAFRRQQEKTNDRRDFSNANMSNIHEVYSALTTAQCGYLMLLQCYVDYNGVLVKSSRNKTPMSTADMMDVLQLGKKPRTFYDFLAACIERDIIREADDGYSVNERYHFKGNFGSQCVVKLYTAKIKRVYSEVKATDIGLIYRMLPFIHFETNALCENPFEKNPKRIRWFNKKELAEAIGVTPDTLGRRLKQMKFDGEYVVARIKVGTEPERFTFNPNVFYRQSKTPDKTLIALFNVKKV
ncbi:AsnC family protein [Bacillus subtilis]|nr:AsnC family protein [Bacillus subtilis]NLS42699.1 AsnC family protein [Bacillus subtilis]